MSNSIRSMLWYDLRPGEIFRLHQKGDWLIKGTRPGNYWNVEQAAPARVTLKDQDRIEVFKFSKRILYDAITDDIEFMPPRTWWPRIKKLFRVIVDEIRGWPRNADG